VLWSVSVEEQFYLFWPLIIAFVPKKHLLKTFIIIILGSVAFRFFYAQGSGVIIKYHSFSSVSDLATGAVIAYLACKESFIEKISRIPKSVIMFIYFLLFTIIPLRLYIWKFAFYYNHVAAVTPLIFSSLFVFIILEQNYAKHSFYKVSNFKIISSFGKYTYGMYCYHMISFFAVLLIFHLMGININGMSLATFIFVFFTSFFSTALVSELSYTYYESFFLRLKNRFALITKD
ncbi:MAG: acyltransferase family protein, partial [Bacteroidia bacterium]